MLNIGWSEMLIVAAIALIVVGPKDLPAMLRQLGKVFGTVRRMGNEFKSEISKVAALDEIKDIKSSLTKPLQDTHEELTNQFNTIGKDGVEPSGAIKPAVEGQESVVNEIRESAGMTATPTPDPAAAASSMKAAIARAGKDAEDKTADAKTETVKPARAKRAAPRKSTAKKPTTKAKTTRAKSAPAKRAPAKKPAAKKTAAAKTSVAKSRTRKAPAKQTAATAKEAKPATAVKNKGGIPAKTAAKLQRAPAKSAPTSKGDA